MTGSITTLISMNITWLGPYVQIGYNFASANGLEHLMGLAHYNRARI
jgi:hypothetical protein